MSWDRTTPVESFCPGIERLQGSPSVMGWNDSRESVLVERLQGSHCVMDTFCPRVILSWSHSVLESFCPAFIPGQMDSRGVLQSLDGTTPREVLLS